jgi:hypothetical protein
MVGHNLTAIPIEYSIRPDLNPSILLFNTLNALTLSSVRCVHGRTDYSSPSAGPRPNNELTRRPPMAGTTYLYEPDPPHEIKLGFDISLSKA